MRQNYQNSIKKRSENMISFSSNKKYQDLKSFYSYVNKLKEKTLKCYRERERVNDLKSRNWNYFVE